MAFNMFLQVVQVGTFFQVYQQCDNGLKHYGIRSVAKLLDVTFQETNIKHTTREGKKKTPL